MWIKDWDKDKLKDLTVLTRKDLTKGGKNIIPAVFYVHTYYSDSVEQHEAEPGYDFIGKWGAWLDDSRVYVAKPKSNINEDLLV